MGGGSRSGHSSEILHANLIFSLKKTHKSQTKVHRYTLVEIRTLFSLGSAILELVEHLTHSQTSTVCQRKGRAIPSRATLWAGLPPIWAWGLGGREGGGSPR